MGRDSSGLGLKDMKGSFFHFQKAAHELENQMLKTYLSS